MDNDTTKSGQEIDSNRGIQNAQARFERRSEARTTSAQLQNSDANARIKARENDRRAGDSLRTEREAEEYEYRSQENPERSVKHQYRNIQKTFEDAGETIDTTDIEEVMEMKSEKASLPPFPYFIFTIAVLKDIIDVIATITVVGIVLSVALSFLFALILFFWTMGKMSGGWWKKRLIKYLLIRYGITIAIEFIPGVNIIPTTTIFILMAHYHETKIVKLLNTALEKMHSAGMK